MSENNITSITIVNDISVVVPDSPQYMTTYILQEQHDWFEDEIKFIRSYIKPGMNIIDIGANYGLYTLTFASIIGDTGRIWAFEPTKFTSICLNKSISENKFKNINLIQSGLSNRLGKAKLYVSPNSEVNSLSKEATSTDQFEEISLLTLDNCMHKFKWGRIDFIKLDAEGEEMNILRKGETTLSSLSPLIMFELAHGKNFNLPLIDRFKNMGYESYRLLPGLNILIPFDHKKPFDGHLLNIFCCKEDKAKLLESEGVIVKTWEKCVVENDSCAHEYIDSLVFGESLKNYTSTANDDYSSDYLEILNLYVMSQSKTASSSCRVGCLIGALNKLRGMMAKGENHIERLATFSRIAFDAGERALGVQILSGLINKYYKNIDFKIHELFLPASQLYDGISPNTRVNEWLFSSILEQCIKKHAYSTYFTQKATVPLFERLNDLGFISEDMRSRYQLVKDCFIQ